MNPALPDRHEMVLTQCSERLGPCSAASIASDVDAMNRLNLLLDDEEAFTDGLMAWAFSEARSSETIREEFVLNLLPDLTRAASRMASPEFDARFDLDDILQSALGDSLPGLFDETFTSRVRFIAFMARRIKWKVVDKVRAQRTLRCGGNHIRVSSSALLHEPGESRSQLSQLQSAEVQESLALRVMGLPDGMREVLLGVLDGKSNAELAAELGISRNAVQHRLDRAREKLREGL